MEKQPKGGTRESLVGSFETVEFQVLTGADIEDGDRAFIYTESGNRYMVRHSKSRGGALVIYNERSGGFASGTEHPFLVREKKVAVVGEPMAHFYIIDEKEQRGAEVSSTKVTRIELRKNVENVISEAEKQISGGGIAQMLKDHTRGIDEK